MKVTKKLREEAAEIASLTACTGAIAADCFIGEPAYRVYWEAWCYVTDTLEAAGVNWQPDDPELDAEAESLLRTGWTP